MTDSIDSCHSRAGGNPEGDGLGLLIDSIMLLFRHPLIKGGILVLPSFSRGDFIEEIASGEKKITNYKVLRLNNLIFNR